MTMKCPTCGQTAPTGAKFCDNCGTRVDAAVSSPLPQGTPDFADVSGVSALPDAGQETEIELPAVTRVGGLTKDEPAVAARLPTTVTVPPVFASLGGDCSQLTLRFTDSAEFGRIHVFAGSELKLGRVSEVNDVVLWKLPRSKENDAASNRISSQHARLWLDAEGLKLSDRDSRNGTSLNGQSVRGTAQVPLNQVSEIELAGCLKLRLTPFLGASDLGANRDLYRTLGLPDETSELASRLGLTAITLERVDNQPRQECYLLLLTWAALGPTACNSSSATRQQSFRLVRRKSQVWLHCLSGQAEVANHELAAGQVAPLMRGLALRLGDRRVNVTAIDQWGMS